MRSMEFSNNLQEANHTHLTKLWYLITGKKFKHPCQIVYSSLFLIEFPNKEERLTDVFIGWTRVVINNTVNNRTNFVDKKHDTFL